MTRSARLFLLVMLAAATGGCATTPASRTGAASHQAAAADLDSFIYARPADQLAAAPLAAAPLAAAQQAAAPPTTARAQAVVAAPVLVSGPLAAPVVGVPVVAVDPAAAFAGEPPYRLDSGDKLRVMVFGQEGLTNTYIVDQSGTITMPLIKTISARGLTTDELARTVAERLRRGFIREPHVAIEVETYRPFFILGEVTLPGQYAYVPHMTVENAIAIAGGFTPRAYRWDIKLDRPAPGGVVRNTVPPLTRVRPGDTIIVKERWF